MPAVTLTEQVFQAAQAQAIRAGFGSVAEYIADVVLAATDDAAAPTGFDAIGFFTAERAAQLDAAAASARAGRVYTAEQVDAELAKRRAGWLKANGR